MAKRGKRDGPSASKRQRLSRQQAIPNANQHTPFPFLRLPFELRIAIYNFSMVSRYPLYPTAVADERQKGADYRAQPINTSLLRVNRQVSQEALEIFRTRNTGVVGDEKHRDVTRKSRDHWPWLSDRERRSCRKSLMQDVYPSLFYNLARVQIKIDWVFSPATDHLQSSDLRTTDVRMLNFHFRRLVNMLRPLSKRLMEQAVDRRKVLVLSFPYLNAIAAVQQASFLTGMREVGLIKLLQDLTHFRTVQVEHGGCASCGSFHFGKTSYPVDSSPYKKAVDRAINGYVGEEDEPDSTAQAVSHFEN